MRIQGFEWDSGNIEHIARHGVDTDEAEQAVGMTNVFRRTHSGRYIAYGQTDAGRHLTVVFELHPGNTARVVTAREMTKRETQYYRERRQR